MKKQAYWKLYTEILIAQKEDRLHEVVNDIIRGIKYAKKYGDNHLYYHFSYIYHSYNYLVKQDPKIGARSLAEFEKAKELRDYEEKASMEFSELAFELNRSRRPSIELKNRVDKYCDEMKPLTKLGNFGISAYVYPILIAKAYLDIDYGLVNKYCDEAIELSEKYAVKSHHFHSLKTLALIISKKYNEAEKTIQKARNKVKKKRGRTWSVYIYYQTINLLHSKRYEEAYIEMREADKREYIDKTTKEQWLIVKGFVQIIINANLLKIQSRFRIGKMLNEVPIFNADKYGNFINILILKIVLGIQENKERVIEEREAIERAYFRYCEKGSREFLFLKVLLKIPLYKFDKSLVVKNCTPDVEKLLLMPMRPSSIDIIPWEKIWDIVLEELDENKRA